MIADAGGELVQIPTDTGAIDAGAVIDPEQGKMIGAENIFLLGIEKLPSSGSSIER